MQQQQKDYQMMKIRHCVQKWKWNTVIPNWDSQSESTIYGNKVYMPL